MSIEDTKAKIAVMQAYVDGKPIEYKARHDPNDPWELNGDPGWAFENCDYRVAPPKPREVFLIYSTFGAIYSVRTDIDCDEADSLARNIGGTYAKFVEVL